MLRHVGLEGCGGNKKSTGSHICDYVYPALITTFDKVIETDTRLVVCIILCNSMGCNFVVITLTVSISNIQIMVK